MLKTYFLSSLNLPMENKGKEIGADLKAQADILFTNLNEGIEKIKSQIDSISHSIDELQNKLNISVPKNE